tara:strand:- start:24448 stop:26166 length:1719 start_codon:yes stop_codon:yes gene_type:complete
MAQTQPFGFACKGGLDINQSQFMLQAEAGTAVELVNFEIDTDGGYRRINGHLGIGTTASPNTGRILDYTDSNAVKTDKILGITGYAAGGVAASGTNLYFVSRADSGTLWVPLNRISSVSTLSYSTHTGFLSTNPNPRTNQEKIHFKHFEGSLAGNGSLVVCDGVNNPVVIEITGGSNHNINSLSRTYAYTEIPVGRARTDTDNNIHPQFSEVHQTRLLVSGDPSTPNTVYYSSVNFQNTDDCNGGSVTVEDKVTGLKSFRGDVIIFCENSIYRLKSLGDATNQLVEPVSKNIGCLDFQTIQEVGGDLVFLAPDGIRTLAGTEKIGDTELGSVSRQIQTLVRDNIVKKLNTLTLASVVIKEKAQYRLFYTAKTGEDPSGSKGIIGTITNEGFVWSETLGIQCTAIESVFDPVTGLETVYHGDKDGYIYTHEFGNDFYNAGTKKTIFAAYKTPFLDFGDAGTRKTLNYLKISMRPEGNVQPTLRIRYDNSVAHIPQPDNIIMDTVPAPAEFGVAVFENAPNVAGNIYGGTADPLVRQSVQGSGYTMNFRLFSDDNNDSYTINGIYADYYPSGRR